MTQASTPTPPLAWCANLQAKLMAALEALWTRIERTDDPAEIRRVRDKAKAIGDLAAMARKVTLIVPMARGKPAPAGASPAAWEASPPAALSEPLAAQVEHARRALDKLKGGRRGRL